MENILFFFGLGPGFFLYGIFVFCRTAWSRRRCRRRVNAVISDVDVTWIMVEDSKVFKNYYYHPVYRYTVDGQEYRVVSRVEYSRKDAVKVGSDAVLFVDAENPRRFYCPAEKGDNVLNASFWSAMGIAWVLVPFLGWIGAILIGLALLALSCLCYRIWLRKRQE